MKQLLASFIILAGMAHAQAPANTVLIGPEGISVVSTTAKSPVTYEFGAGTAYNSFTATLPLSVACGNGCPLMGGDPAYGVVKSIYAVQQATAYTVTIKNAAGVVQAPIAVPALAPPPVVTPPVTPVATNSITFSINQTIGGKTYTASCVASLVSQ